MYQALYRKYRPSNFDDILGQKHIINTLKNQIQTKSIGHAYLFSGTRGTGKTSTAKIFSRAVNCLDPIDSSPCNQCEMCKGILDESIMDVIEMDAASNRRIDDIRDLIDKVVYPPSRTKYKVYIIDEVHMLTTQAFNALLKTLEEPPKHLIFILATTEPEKLPQTILSRCQRFDFKRVISRDIIRNMENIAIKEDIEVDPKVLNLIARNVDGAMRDALSLLDQCISFSSGKITYEDAINILGITNSDLMFNMVDDILGKNLENLLSTVDQIIQDGKDINQFIKDLVYHFRNLMIIKTSKSPMDLLELDEETLKKYIVQSKNISLNFILTSLETLTLADEKSRWSTQPRIILEMAAIKLSKQEDIELEERVRKLEMGIKTSGQRIEEKPKQVIEPEKYEKLEKKKPEGKKENSGQEKSLIIEDGKELEFDSILRNWDEILKEIRKKKINIYALLIEGKPTSYQNEMLTITYEKEFDFHKNAVSTETNKEFIEEIILNYFKRKIDLNFTIKNDKMGLNVDKKKDDKKAIKEVIDFFGKDKVEIK